MPCMIIIYNVTPPLSALFPMSSLSGCPCSPLLLVPRLVHRVHIFPLVPLVSLAHLFLLAPLLRSANARNGDMLPGHRSGGGVGKDCRVRTFAGFTKSKAVLQPKSEEAHQRSEGAGAQTNSGDGGRSPAAL
jgi:hypothetical protein